MSIYLHDIPLDQAQARLDEALAQAGLAGVLGSENIPLDEQAVGRVLAAPIWATISSPHYHAAAMDGFAVRSSETVSAMPTQPVYLRYGAPAAGAEPSAGSAIYVDTGDPLPAWADAVIPIENIEPLDEQGQMSAQARQPWQIRIRAALAPWNHVRPLGEDIVASQLVLPAGHTLRPIDLGAAAASGQTHLVVARQPRVAILPTGTELIEIGRTPRPGDIIEYNSLVLAAQVGAWGGQATRWPIIPDDAQSIAASVQTAAQEHDLVLLNAGSSAGSEDYSASVVAQLGDLLVHGVAVRPGHPVILGMLHVPAQTGLRQVPIIGVPGYPVSAALTGEIFVEPLLARWLGRPPAEPAVLEASLTRKLTSPPGDDDYVRMVVGRVGERWLAAPLQRGAGVISSLVRADGLAIVPRGAQGLAAGDRVRVRLYRSQAELERTILAIGSHDILLDLLAQHLGQVGRRLASANVGSQGGLVALRRSEAHIAGSHLLDPQTGEYNLSAVREYLPGLAVRIIALSGRDQGLFVQPGNPKGIHDLEALARPDVRFINRQRGAGTRVLLDYHLNLKNIAVSAIQGYNQEEYTHLAVAAAVASGRADCALGIAAAAQALHLDFIPLFQERYDLIIPEQHVHSELLRPLLGMLQDTSFRQAAALLPGYHTEIMGQQIALLD